MADNPLAGRDLISITDLSRAEIVFLLDRADQLQSAIRRERQLGHLRGYLLATLFYEPSTRTRLSFEAAMLRLGGEVISVADARTASSAAKGESIADAARVVASYADVIVQRHPAVGSAREAADAVNVPVINAGDGSGEHPTQALLDLLTVRREKGRLDGLTVALAGDLKHGRTVHSLSRALAYWNNRLILVSPPSLAMGDEMVNELRTAGLQVDETDDLRQAIGQADVLYVTRIQKERFADPADYERLKDSYVVNRALLAGRPELTVMHPLPRVNEIATDTDDLANAAYFRQAENGLWARIALLTAVLDA
ncbi:MAG: aspartate carbamoyltransferase [Anaerolineae bacterium]|nr:aspartate carbamoyltransferase [Anaerolineae bacterium]